MEKTDKPCWRLSELLSNAARVLAAEDNKSDSSRARMIPSERTLRYYTTFGLLDRPAEIRGRTAYYSWRHLLQIVAIKRLQGDGITLVDIQQRLGGRPDEALAAIARLPVDMPEVSLTGPESQNTGEEKEQVIDQAKSSPKRESFWLEQADEPVSLESTPEPVIKFQGRRSLQSMGIEDLMLIWHGRPASLDEIAALKDAAGPLVAEMERCGLLNR